MRIAYVICLYGGPRFPKHRKFEKDVTINMKTNIELLNELDHDIDDIYFVVNREILALGPRLVGPHWFYEEIKNIPNKLGKADVHVVHRPNIGISYGAFSQIYTNTRGQYDYYYFSEDDFVFTLDNWDTRFLDMLSDYRKLDETYGYICAYACPWEGLDPNFPDADSPIHAAMPHGLITAEACEKVLTRFSYIPHSEVEGDYPNDGPPGQVTFSNSFYYTGTNIGDILPWYRSGYMDNDYGYWFGEMDNEVLCSPVDFLPPSSYRENEILPQTREEYYDVLKELSLIPGHKTRKRHQ